MKHVVLSNENGLRTFALVLDAGEDAAATVTAFANDSGLRASHFTAIGGFSDAVIAYFEWTTKRYREIPVDEQVEVLSLVGDLTEDGDRVKLHAHAVLGRADGSVRGGHLLCGHVRPTLEIMLTETPAHLRRRFDPRSGLALIDGSRAG